MPQVSGSMEMVPFHGDEIAAIRGEDGKPYVVVKRICENIGVAFQSQIRNLQTTHSHWSCITMMMTHDSSGREQEIAVIPIDKIPMWLVQIKLTKVAPQIREKLRLYQIEAADVLARHFTPQAARSEATTIELILQQQLIANARYDGSIAILSRETADIRQEIAAIKAEQLRFATTGRTVIHYVPEGYHRFHDWCSRNDVPKPGNRQAEEIHRARDISARRGVPVYRCEVGGRPAAYYFTHDILQAWVSDFRRRCPSYFFKTLGFAD